MNETTTTPQSPELSAVKKALMEVRELRQRLDAQRAQSSEPLAIVGVGCRLPGGVKSPQDYWKLLQAGEQPIIEVPSDRWDARALFDANPDAPGRSYCTVGAFVDGAAQFDPYFFGIPPREAQSMDPQQRLLMEVSWEALESAGHDPSRLNGSNTGVFVGIGSIDYAMLESRSLAAADIDAYLGSGFAHSVAAGRLSYFFGFQGPCFAVDTACSSSLVAIHQACMSLRTRECDLALAGGVSLMLTPDLTINFCRARMLSPTGSCHTFDAAADGYIRGEGAAVIVLKRLSDAIAAGDTIHAVIRGSAINQDGRSTGLTVPNGPAQEAVITSALKSAGLQPSQVQYVEAHGTGTPLGDPIEVQALAAALGGSRTAANPLLIGSVKTNIGHLESAAGIAGLLKVVLSMQAGEIPPHVGFKTPSPHIDWKNLPVAVTAAACAWPEGKRIAGVSSFGFSGTNAHVILEEAPKSAARAGVGSARPLHVLALSAKSEPAMRALAADYADRISSGVAESIADICYTAGAGRAHFAHRAAVIGSNASEMSRALQAVARGESATGAFEANSRKAPEVGFLFTGQGAQYVGMGKSLYASEAVFREVIDRCAKALEGVLERDLRTVMFEESGGLLDQTQYTQPALYALEVGLARLWKSWGIEPTVVLGHSVGEYAAACIAGVYEVEAGARLIGLRGKLMQGLPSGGGMLSVQGDPAVVEQALKKSPGKLWLAARNAPQAVVVSGDEAELKKLSEELQQQGCVVQPLHVSHAFHSAHLEPMLEEFGRHAQATEASVPRVSWISNLTGEALNFGEWRGRLGEYWTRHAREAVQFERGIRAARAQGVELFIEVGPHPVLSGLGRATLGSDAQVSWLASLRRGRGEWEQLLESVGQGYVQGLRIDWRGFTPPDTARIVSLPTYPFQRQRYWIEQSAAAQPTRVAPQADSQASWKRAKHAGNRQANYGPVDLVVDSFPHKWALLEQLSRDYIVAAFRSLSMFTRAGESWTAAELVANAAVQPVYTRLVARWLTRLVAAGLLESQGDKFTARKPLPTESDPTLLERTRAAFADYPVLFEYVELCGGELADVLTGRQSALETLFPGGSNHITDGLYQTSVVARYYNEIVRAVVQAIAARDGQLSILEIGAGTGGTTSLLLPELPANRTRYVFTDVSRLFLGKASEKFADYPFVEYSLFNAERTPEEQGYTSHSFDVVVAANVLHATGDLAATLRNARSLLSSGGVLVMLETTDHPIWLDISTGLIEGWQKFDDPLRTSHPLLDVPLWSGLLKECGFVEVDAFPSAGAKTELLGQHVIVSRAPEVATAAGHASTARASDAGDVPTRVRKSNVEAPEALRERLTAALPEGRHEILVDLVCREAGAVCGADARHLPGPDTRLMEFGVDSLMAVELRNQLAQRLGLTRKLTATLIFDYPTPDAIARHLANDELGFGSRPVAQAAPAPISITPALDVATVEAMDDAEAEALLAAKLRQI